MNKIFKLDQKKKFGVKIFGFDVGFFFCGEKIEIMRRYKFF